MISRLVLKNFFSSLKYLYPNPNQHSSPIIDHFRGKNPKIPKSRKKNIHQINSRCLEPHSKNFAHLLQIINNQLNYSNLHIPKTTHISH